MDRDWPFAEYDDRSDSDRRAETYPEIDWIRFDMGRAAGWTAHTFKALFGVWPERWMKDLTPVPASAALQRWVRRRDNAWKKDVKEREQLKLAGGSDGGRGRNGALRRTDTESDTDA